MLTYGDGVSDVNVQKLVEFHQAQKKILTLTAIQPEGRFGVLDIGAGHKVQRFLEKPRGDALGSTAGSLFANREFLATSAMETKRFSNALRWKPSPAKVSCQLISTKDFGSAWTPFAINRS